MKLRQRRPPRLAIFSGRTLSAAFHIVIVARSIYSRNSLSITLAAHLVDMAQENRVDGIERYWDEIKAETGFESYEEYLETYKNEHPYIKRVIQAISSRTVPSPPRRLVQRRPITEYCTMLDLSNLVNSTVGLSLHHYQVDFWEPPGTSLRRLVDA